MAHDLQTDRPLATRNRTASRLSAAPATFFQEFPDHIQLKVPLRKQALEPGVLLLHLPEPLYFILLQRPETPAPKVEGLHRNLVTLAGVLDGLAQRVHLTQNRHVLLV